MKKIEKNTKKKRLEPKAKPDKRDQGALWNMWVLKSKISKFDKLKHRVPPRGFCWESINVRQFYLHAILGLQKLYATIKVMLGKVN